MNKTEYKNKFNQEHYERIHLAVPKGMKQVIRDLASEKGPFNQWIFPLFDTQ